MTSVANAYPGPSADNPEISFESLHTLRTSALELLYAAHKGEPFGAWKVSTGETEYGGKIASFTVANRSNSLSAMIGYDPRDSQVLLRRTYAAAKEYGQLVILHEAEVGVTSYTPSSAAINEPKRGHCRFADQLPTVRKPQEMPLITWQEGLDDLAKERGRQPVARQSRMTRLLQKIRLLKKIDAAPATA